MLTILGDKASEGDVEAGVVLPLLTHETYLGIPLQDIRSKASIPPRDIGKGTKRRIGYVPDFVILKASLPLMVVEAKSPENDVLTAYTEGRLYAAEINSGFGKDINPCSRVLATNGMEVLFGYWDTEPLLKATVKDLAERSAELDVLKSSAVDGILAEWADHVSQKLRPARFKRPFNRGVGESQILSRIEPNTFAIDLAPTLNRYFASRSQEDDEAIYRYAYISSNEVTSYDRLLESHLRDRLAKSKVFTPILTSKNDAKAVTKKIAEFSSRKRLAGDIQLVTGGVGAGKSLFARRYKEYLQPEELLDKNHWAFLNFNNAPDDHRTWAAWICDAFCTSIQEEGAPFDLRNGQDQERIFADDLAERKPFYERMNKGSPGRGDLEMARDIEQWRQDAQKLTRSIARYVQGDRRENLIVVFDNVDRRDSESQLAAFQSALWFMDQTRCLIVLQMRDATFEAFKKEPPLDTYKTGQIFHIAPPRFVDVVRKRLELSLKELDSLAGERIKFRTSSGPTFTYPKKRAGEFLLGIYKELFETRSNLSRLLEALAGRNVRQALDMFMTIITSGHLPEEVLVSVAQGRGFEQFPQYLILRALMRRDYRFFSDETDAICNIFYCQNSWKRPSNLLLPEIIFALLGQRKARGDNGQMGFVALPRLKDDMELLGFVASDVQDALVYALQKGLIEADTSSTKVLRQQDCVKSTASAWAHLRVLSSRVEYLWSVLPTTPLSDEEFANSVFDLMQIEARHGSLYLHQMARSVAMLKRYLIAQSVEQSKFPGFVERNRSGTAYLLEKLDTAINWARRENPTPNGQIDWLDI